MDSRKQESRQKTPMRLSTSSSLPALNVPTVSPAEFLKSFKKINVYLSKAQRAVQMEQLKRVRIKAIDDQEFSRAMRHLENVATQPRFISEYVELQPWKAVTGFLDEGMSQYFTIMLKGEVSPLNVVIQRSKGVVESFFSYKSLRPGPEIHDFRFKTNSFKVEGRFTRFRDPSACLCVKAISDCTFAIMITFGEDMPMVDEEDPKLPVLALNQAQPVTFLAESLEELFSNISTAPSICSINFIELNKSAGSWDVRKPTHKEKERRAQVKQRKEQQYQERKERVRNQAERIQRREQALDQSRYITSILERKARFERIWLGLIFFARATYEAHRRFRIDKDQSIYHTKRFLICYRIQRKFRKQFNGKFQLIHHYMATARDSFKMASALIYHHTFKHVQRNLMHCMRKGRMESAVGRFGDKFYERMGLIQKLWRTSKLLEKYFKRHLIYAWDFLLNQLLKKQEESRKKKRNKKKGGKRRYYALPEDSKLEVLNGLFADCIAKQRTAFAEDIHAGVRLSTLLPKGEVLKAIVKEFSSVEKQEAA